MPKKMTKEEMIASGDYVRVQNIHTARVAGVPSKQCAYVKKYVAKHYDMILIASPERKTKGPSAAELIEKIGNMSNVDELEALAAEESRSTVRDAAEFRILELAED